MCSTLSFSSDRYYNKYDIISGGVASLLYSKREDEDKRYGIIIVMSRGSEYGGCWLRGQL